MLFPLLQDICNTRALDIVLLLKSSTGLSVNELARKLKMSYMGVKQHCTELEKRGVIDTWRRPGPRGRPEKAFRLTRKTEPLFPQAGNDLALDMLVTAARIYGETAPQKLLFSFFQAKGDRYLAKMKGKSVIERAESLARLRTAEGSLSKAEYDAAGGLRLAEYHNVYGDTARRYPQIIELERAMIETVLGYPVERAIEEASGLNRIVFKIRALGS